MWSLTAARGCKFTRGMLCAEEVCPILVSKASKLHWPLPDPAGKGGSDEEQLERFRGTRDEIRKRLEVFGREMSLSSPTSAHQQER